jgi:hypothetical protein
MDFKIGSTYTRDEIHTAYNGAPIPDTGTGNWTTGYVRIDDELILFLNINVPGTTGHDFPNKYDPETKTLEMFGKPNTHSRQPLMDKLINHKLKAHCFASGITGNHLRIWALERLLITVTEIRPLIATEQLQQALK